MEINPLLETVRAHKLGLLIFDARTAAGKSLEMASAQSGIPAADLQSYENGVRIPSLPEIEGLAYVLDVPIEHFWGRQSISEEKGDLSRTMNPKVIMVRQKMISSFLELKRNEKKITTAELSRLSGLPEERIHAYENADLTVPVYDLEALSAALGLTMADFFDQRGAVAEWRKSQRGKGQPQSNLPPEIQEFVNKPINRPYLELAMKFSEMPVDKLRTLAESILEITF
ncbi:MAG: helix-turn-helix transcriptional regulator [Anaerolineaceae bacterium]